MIMEEEGGSSRFPVVFSRLAVPRINSDRNWLGFNNIAVRFLLRMIQILEFLDFGVNQKFDSI